MTALPELLGHLSRLTLVVGKGGVGKTTIAAGIAAHLAASGRRTLLLSTDPASALGAAIGQPLSSAPATVRDQPNLDGLQLSAASAREAFLLRWRDTIVAILDRGTYLDLDDISGLVDAALPGADEIFALLEIAALAERPAYERIVVDTAPTGHTLRLLALPDTFRALVSLLDSMQEKHRFMVRALTHRYRRDRADDFIDEMRSTIARFQATLSDPAQSAAVLVARAEAVVVAETARYAAALTSLPIRIGAVVVNAWPAAPDAEAVDALSALTAVASDVPHFEIPFSTAQPIGLNEIESLLTTMCHPDRERSEWEGSAFAAAVASRAEVKADPSSASRRRDDTYALPRLAPLTITGGKGGVGKTTVSCALAIAAADSSTRVLLVSTDPAPSIADALAQAVDDAERSVDAAPGLTARQMDAGAAFARLRDEYQDRIDALFDALVGRGVDIALDRAILRDLLALAPPGIDELYALASLGETIAEHRFDCIIVDPAPTGHLLRLLEMPAIALDWTHRLMRLMLKYKDVAGLGDTAQELLDFSRRTRALDELLHDGGRAALIIVALDEPLVRGESSRLVASVRTLGMHVGAIVWNRVTRVPAPLPVDPPAAQFVAPAAEPAPVGVAELRSWLAQWTELSGDG